MTKSKIMGRYYSYMSSNEKLRVGTYEVNELSRICEIKAEVLIFFGARANATQAPIAIKEGWYIYSLEERILGGETKYYITIDNALKYI